VPTPYKSWVCSPPCVGVGNCCHVGEGAAPTVNEGVLSGSSEGWKQWWAAVRREAGIVMAVRLS
jgi:hypothetical protein